MGNWIISLLLRIASGERFRKATPTELRWFSGAFAFIPIWGALFIYVGHSYLDRASGVGIWFFMMACLLVAGLTLAVWTKFVPAAVSWVFGAIIWAVTLWLAFTNRLI